jgi:hypothetical protein
MARYIHMTVLTGNLIGTIAGIDEEASARRYVDRGARPSVVPSHAWGESSARGRALLHAGAADRSVYL